MASSPLPTPPSAPRPRVVLAEDDDDMRSMLAGMLAADGWEVIEAADGSSLVERLHEIAGEPRGRDTVLAVVADVRMPRLDGLDVLAALRCAGWRTPVVLMTAFGDGAVHREARELGAVQVLDKPFALDRLRDVLRQIAPRRR
ncbi:MAG: response regulator [Myxococcales bacterium]|nr:response regulator [Myxococcales bacterium]